MTFKTEHLLYNHMSFHKPSERPETFSMHCHNTYELIFFEKGEANYIIDEKKYKLHKNDLIFIRPFKYHYIEFTRDTEYSRINIAFPDTFVNSELLRSIAPEIEVVNFPPESIIAGLFARMDYYSERLDNDGFAEILSAMLTEVLYNLRLVDIDMAYIPSSLTPLLSEAIGYINENLFSIKEIREISNRFNISEQYFFRLFRAQLHISPYRYLIVKRLLHAQNMLRQGKHPTEIYYQCGFDSYVSFYKQYVKMFGYAPSRENPTVKL